MQRRAAPLQKLSFLCRHVGVVNDTAYSTWCVMRRPQCVCWRNMVTSWSYESLCRLCFCYITIQCVSG